MNRVIVVGAGVVGSSIAYRLAEAGAQVTILDQSEAGSGTTGASFAWANANQKTPRDYFDLNYAGLKEHHQLIQEFGGAPWFQPSGNLIWTGDPVRYDELKLRAERLDSWGYQVRWMQAGQVNAELEPNLAFSAPTMPVAYFPEEGWVNAPALARHMLEQLGTRNGNIVLGQSVQSIDLTANGVRVVTENGTTHDGDAVVNAAGPGADRIAKMVGRELPLAPTRGLLVRLKTGSDILQRVVHSTRINARPDGKGTLLIHHDSVDAMIGPRGEVPIEDELTQELYNRVQRILPLTAEATIERTFIGTRPYPSDGRSSIGGVSSLPGYYEAVTHSGVTLGPLFGRLLVKEIKEGEIDRVAEPFRPDRFGNGS